MHKRPEHWPAYFVVLIVFVFKLFDSLYVQQHGDALGYHLLAPLTWARFGWDYVSLYQLIQWQGSLLESLLTLAFKAYHPVTAQSKTTVLILFQVLSCLVGYLLVPLFLLNRLGKTNLISQLTLLSLFYGAAFLTFTWSYAKNDSYACLSFLIFALSKNRYARFAGGILAVGFKATYFYAVVLWAVVEWIVSDNKTFGSLKDKLQLPFFAVAIGLGPFILRNYLVTGNPIFPFPSSTGMQPSVFLDSYFHKYMGQSNLYEVGHKLSLLLFNSPVVVMLFIFVILASVVSRKMNSSLYFGFIVVVCLFVTGPFLEWRTLSGVVLACGFKAFQDLQLPKFKNAVLMLLLLVGISTSKIDPSSFKRWLDAKDKPWWELTANGRAFNELNNQLTAEDVVLTQHFTEGYFLIPQLYQVTHHPKSVEILNRFSLFANEANFLAIRTTGNCHQKGFNESLTNALLQKSQADIQPDPKNSQIFWLSLDCSSAG